MHKLVLTYEYFLLVYETKEAADRGPAGASVALNPKSTTVADIKAQEAAALVVTAYWSKQLSCQVWYSKPGDVFLTLEEDKKKNLLKVLHGNRVGWIYTCDWLELQEVRND